MKKIIAILLLSFYLLSAVRLNEWLKLNVLIEHFYETQKEGSAVTFFRFLVMHYITDDLNNKDNDRDKELPFKSTGICILNSDSIDIPGDFITALAALSFIANKNCFLKSKELLALSDYRYIIWHPPQYT